MHGIYFRKTEEQWLSWQGNKKSNNDIEIYKLAPVFINDNQFKLKSKPEKSCTKIVT